MLRARSAVVPVLLGPTIPRADRSPSEYKRWCHAMLILFKPWRVPSDLKGPAQSWKDAFERFDFSADAKRIMRNMNVENECQDARDDHSRQRKAD
ncbi:hypothetical protein B0H13DRAFT_1608479, partial [Mycena leptocephala]